MANSIDVILNRMTSLGVISVETNLSKFISSILDNIRPKKSRFLSGNLISTEIIMNISNKLLDKNYLPDKEELDSIRISLNDFVSILNYWYRRLDRPS